MTYNIDRWIAIAAAEHADCARLNAWGEQCAQIAGPDLLQQYDVYCDAEDYPIELDAWLREQGLRDVPDPPSFDIGILPQGDERRAYENWLMTYDGPKGDRFYLTDLVPNPFRHLV
jgi:hypothetical protein